MTNTTTRRDPLADPRVQAHLAFLAGLTTTEKAEYDRLTWELHEARTVVDQVKSDLQVHDDNPGTEFPWGSRDDLYAQLVDSVNADAAARVALHSFIRTVTR